MKRRVPPEPVMGVHAPPSRATVAAAFWLATILSIPVAVAGVVAEALWRMVF